VQQATQKQSRKPVGPAERQPKAPSAVEATSGADLSLRRDLTLRLVQAQVADVVGLMMRSERHRHYSIGDLEWMLLPPLMLNQLLISYARPGDKAKAPVGDGMAPAAEQAPPEQNGKQTPQAPIMAVAMVSFARTSPEVFAKLDAQKKAGMPYRLVPHEWASGEIVRVIDTIGSPEKIKELVENVRKAQAKQDIAIQC
jgi:hemolysin-activating ACP:hemolysin acyltransferase